MQTKGKGMLSVSSVYGIKAYIGSILTLGTRWRCIHPSALSHQDRTAILPHFPRTVPVSRQLPPGR